MRALLGLLAALCAVASVQAAPLEAYGRLPDIEMASISPDGAQVAMIVTNGEDRAILLKTVDSGATRSILIGEAKARGLSWAGSRFLLVTTSVTSRIGGGVIAPRSERFIQFAYDLERDKLMHLLDDAAGGLNIIAAPPEVRLVEGEPRLFLTGVHFGSDGRGRTALYEVDLNRGGRSRLVHGGMRDTREWLVAADGTPIATTEYEGRTGRWVLRVAQGRDWPEVLSTTRLNEPPVLLGFGRDPRSLLVAGWHEGEGGLREYQIDDHAWGEVFAPGDSNPIYDPQSQLLIGHRRMVGDEDIVHFFDPADQAVWKAIAAAYPGERVSLADWSQDRSRIVVRVDSPGEGPAYALVDLKRRKADWIGQVYGRLGPADLSPVQPVAFKARDGLALSGYLTAPKGKAARSLPLIVLPHGGPAVRDTPGFDWWAQALASRGYAVLQVNYRGSAGFGPEFLTAGFGEWGGKMQTDLSDGVAHLAADGVIDPKRVCIVGASYGGYAALAGVTLDPGVYRCAASVAGLSDLRKFVLWSKTQKGVAAQRYWNRFMGSEDDRDPVLRAKSPALLVDRVEAPVLLVHGKDDTIVPFDQSRDMAQALNAAGKPVDLVPLDGEDHFLSRGQTRLQMLQAVVSFLETHNPPDAPSS
ncbi:S9 family peptidase [Phenylobacterium sp.]|uniref:alpha/beta hydrolase family protein n=1 Tax=Phenylobacterium sp. TaxID=1871053 RepID=UPI0027320BCB|nr:S9 family peptidase [Phenylobacterium sp.]MDP1617462.1 S9 family peptidase [Phenylobacterium sp.]MDP1987517.1 S9 family peptidase [Phenylobacterium sp.]